MPKQDPNSYISETLRWLDQVDKEYDPRTRAKLYIKLARRYCFQNMYSRTIEMYMRSLEAHDSSQVRYTLAELLIHLYGRDGFDDARALATARISLEITAAIELKQESIKRREKKAELVRDHPALKAIIGESQSVLEICQKILTYAKSPEPVLITGDSGTGKEVVARALAEVSGRKFRAVNSAAWAEGLIESELFGHVKGAFTGATTDKPGLFETQGNVLIFLDEIGDTSPKGQVDLLRVIQEREFCRVGDTRMIRKLKDSTKIVCATAKNLPEEVKAGRFRYDLFQRIQTLPIHCEPLAKRPEDVQHLIRHFLTTEPNLQEYGPFSEFDIDHWKRWVWWRDTSGETLPLEVNIRKLRARVHRAVLEGTLPQKGDRPFADRWGATTYTKEEIERYDWTIALALCRFQKDAGQLMGKDVKATSKTLQRLGLSKKQRKGQEPRA